MNTKNALSGDSSGQMILLSGFIIALIIIGMGSMINSLANSNPYTTQKHSSMDAYYSFIDIREEYGMILKLGSGSGAYSPFNSSNTTVRDFESRMTDMMASHGYILNFIWSPYLNNTPPTAEATIQLFDGKNRLEDTLSYNLETGRIVYDLIPPGNITDLKAITGVTDGQIKLNWTASGDDGDIGKAFKYNLRYSNESIDTMEKFMTATYYPINFKPDPNGTYQNITVLGLDPGTYYFAIVVYDEVLFDSNLSNCNPWPNAVAANWTPSIEFIKANDTVNSSTKLTTERGRNVTIMFSVTDKDKEDLDISLWLDSGSGWYAVNNTNQTWDQYNTTIYNHTIYNINTTWKYYVTVTDNIGQSSSEPLGAPESYYFISGTNNTTAGMISILSNSTGTINLSAPYGGDFNNNNYLNISYRKNGSGILNYVDSSNIARELLMFRIYISGLNSSTGYDMNVTYFDNDGVYPPVNFSQILLNKSTLP